MRLLLPRYCFPLLGLNATAHPCPDSASEYCIVRFALDPEAAGLGHGGEWAGHACGVDRVPIMRPCTDTAGMVRALSASKGTPQKFAKSVLGFALLLGVLTQGLAWNSLGA